jgi:ATP-dependent DNA ligase
VETAEEVNALVNRIWSRGGEGSVLKKLDSPYRRNRVATQVKVKKEGVR